MLNKKYLFITVVTGVLVLVVSVVALFIAQSDEAEDSTRIVKSPSQDNVPVVQDRQAVDVVDKAANLTNLPTNVETQTATLKPKDLHVSTNRQKAAKLNLNHPPQRTASRPSRPIVAGRLIEGSSESIEKMAPRILNKPLLKIDAKDIKNLQNTARRNVARGNLSKSSPRVKPKRTLRRRSGRLRHVRRIRRKTDNPGVRSSGDEPDVAAVPTSRSLQDSEIAVQPKEDEDAIAIKFIKEVNPESESVKVEAKTSEK